jgi:hypothetical protein
MAPHRFDRACAAVLPPLALAASLGVPTPTAHADDPKPARPARPTIALLVGGADGDLKVLRETLEKVPGLTFKVDDLKFADFGRDDALFTGFLLVEIADPGKAGVGAIAKTVAAADTSKKEKRPPAMFVILRYRPDSVKTNQLRTILARVPASRPKGPGPATPSSGSAWTAPAGPGSPRSPARCMGPGSSSGTRSRTPGTDDGRTEPRRNHARRDQ